MLPILPLLAALWLAPPPPDAPADNTITLPEAPPTLLLVEADERPIATIAWTTAAGERVELGADRPYAADADRTPLGRNISCFVSVGGTRLTKGAGHPRGAVVRVGFYKIDNAKPFFDDIAPGSRVEVTLGPVRFNQPVEASPASIVQHLKFGADDLKSCGIPGEAKDQFNTAGPDETLNDRIREDKDARLGVLSGLALDKPGDDPGLRGDATLGVERGTDVTMRVTFDYALLRHLQDPWKSSLPGTFLEPYHFHVEFEAVPEGAEPLDLDALRAEKQRQDRETRPQE